MTKRARNQRGGLGRSDEMILAALSHEFRTPLNGVLGMTRLLAGTRLDAAQKSYVAALEQSGEHLLGLVNQVLDLARLEAGKIELRPSPVDLERLLQGVAEIMSPRAHARGLEIACAVDPGLPEVMADEARLRQVLYNLAGNAVKFTASGGVLLTAERADGAAGAGRAKGSKMRWRSSSETPGPVSRTQSRTFARPAPAAPSARSAVRAAMGEETPARRMAFAASTPPMPGMRRSRKIRS